MSLFERWEVACYSCYMFFPRPLTLTRILSICDCSGLGPPVPRLPTPPPKGALTHDDIEKYSGDLGFASQIVIDLQRLFMCLEMQKDSIDESWVLMAHKMAKLFSGKVVLPMSSNSEWRIGLSGLFVVCS